MAVNTIDSRVQTKSDAHQDYVVGSVISKDGTTIGYRQLGRGPGLVVLHGAMESASSHMELAQALADGFTVYLPDRRGRGLSGPYRENHKTENDIEDVDALLQVTGARYVFGVSSGAIISMEAALVLDAIEQVAIFEPPLVINGSLSTEFVARYDREVSEGNVTGALVTGMLGAQMGPPFMLKLPRWLNEKLAGMMISNQDKNAEPGDVTMRTLAPTLHYDFALVKAVQDKQAKYGNIRARTLLLGGSSSPAYLKTAVRALEKLLPNAKRVEFAGLGHGASGNAAMGGKPELVARAWRDFGS